MNNHFAAGDIVLADWRDALPKAANERRPAVVVEDDGLFDADYPNLPLVPLAEDGRLGAPDLSVRIEPSAQNGRTKPCFALATHPTATSKQRVRRTDSRITAGELGAIRDRIAITLGRA